jgi:hypothetical protein
MGPLEQKKKLWVFPWTKYESPFVPHQQQNFKNFFQFWKLGRDDETVPNIIKWNHPSKGEKKKQAGKDQSPGKQTAQKRQATWRKGNH